jgi:alpha-glucosidase
MACQLPLAACVMLMGCGGSGDGDHGGGVARPPQMAADLPENYARYPGPFRFIRDVPADWAETRMLNGEVGHYVTFAREDRSSDDWYIGSATDEPPRKLRVALDFLERGRPDTAQVHRDGDDADWKTRPHTIAIESRAAKHGDTLDLGLAPGGSQAIHFVAGEAKNPTRHR